MQFFSGFTIGQYIPIESIIHRVDPRTKFIALVIFITYILVFPSLKVYLFFTVIVHILLYCSALDYAYIWRGLRPVLVLLVLTAVFNAFLTPGLTLWWRLTWEGLYYAVLFSFRIYLLVMISVLLTYTTSPLKLTDAIEYFFCPLKYFKVPVADLALTLTIAFRFIPTLIDELDRLMKAQMSRGVDFETGSFFNRIKKLLPVFVPLFVSCFKRAEELADAMESRGYRGGDHRTRREVLHFAGRDVVAFIFIIVAGTLCAVLWYFPIYG